MKYNIFILLFICFFSCTEEDPLSNNNGELYLLSPAQSNEHFLSIKFKWVNTVSDISKLVIAKDDTFSEIIYEKDSIIEIDSFNYSLQYHIDYPLFEMGEDYYWKIETDIGSATTYNSFHVTNHLILLDDYITSDVSGIGYFTGPFEGPPDSYLFDTTNIVTQLELTKGEEFGKLGYYVESDSLPSFINDVLHILSNNPSNSGVCEFETSFDPSARKHCLLRINTQTDDLYYYCQDWFPITHHYKMWGTIE